MTPTSETVLRTLIGQVLELDIGEEGSREGVLYNDRAAGKDLVRRGIATQSATGRLTLTRPALLRILRAAVDAATADLLAHDPPAEDWPGPSYPGAPEATRLLMLHGEPALRGGR